MSVCQHLDAYLDRVLPAGDRQRFEEHLPVCDACRQAIQQWRSIEVDIVEVFEARRPELDAAAGRRLVLQARGRTQRSRRVLGWRWGVALAAATAAALAIVGVSVGPITEGREPKTATLAVELLDGDHAVGPTLAAGALLVANAERRLLLRLGGDRLAVAAGGRVELVEATPARLELRLVDGALALAVSPRRPGEQLRVLTDVATVTVIGTKFGVRLLGGGGLEVGVREGKVRVESAGEAHEVSAGQSLRLSPSGKLRRLALSEAGALVMEGLLRTAEERGDGAEESNEADAELEGQERAALGYHRPLARRSARAGQIAPAAYAEWRQWIVAGRFAEAEAALVQHLAQRRSDVEAWSLLADCRRKAGQPEAAVAAYRQVIRAAAPTSANRARLLAASILQDELAQHRAAIPLLRAYLAHGQPIGALEAAAQVRLARSLAQTGERDAARRLLETVIDEHGQTPAAVEAKRLLTGW